MDLSKEFDTVDHQMIIAKLWGNGFYRNLIAFINSYLTKQFHRTNVNNNITTLAFGRKN